MRRPAVLAFSLFAIAASLPAEVRECLPRTAGCEHRTTSGGASCPRRERSDSCRRTRKADCPRTQPAHDAGSCELHPTPPMVRQPAATALAAPMVSTQILPLAPFDSLLASRSGWREAPTLRPRASPATAPRSPRPPPFTA